MKHPPLFYFNIILAFFLLEIPVEIFPHGPGINEDLEALSKCGGRSGHSPAVKISLDPGIQYLMAAIDTSPGFGYDYSALEADLNIWKNSDYVSVRSLGKSVQQREIYLMTLSQDSSSFNEKNVITMHNRTHPLEVQSWWVQKAMIEFLLSDDPKATELRQANIYYLIPMINPDGVELMEDCSAGFGRCNSLGVDLEREWATTTPQPEVAAVKNFYDSLMHSNNPIDIALNLHSAFGCLRYFWYHHELGTSSEYAYMEQQFIELTRSYAEGFIEPWNAMVSWEVGPPDYFPESWFWLNFGAEVLALTYEDVKDCPEKENNWGIPALALLKGSEDFLNGVEITSLNKGYRKINNFENPESILLRRLYDVLGRKHFIPR